MMLGIYQERNVLLSDGHRIDLALKGNIPHWTLGLANDIQSHPE